ncbi:MAG: LON peptidase substrate-binding domain-containing protein [Bryobacteraceae bacterium]
MPGELLPLFPLSVVLLPENELPLHIFEERYKTMIGLALEKRTEFGVVMATGKGIVSMGCTAAISEVIKQYPDGRMDILTLGQRRFRIHELNQELDYLRGEVTYFDDVDSTAPVDLRQRAMRLAEEARFESEIDSDAPLLSFAIAGRIDDLEFRQRMLQIRSEAERLRTLVDYLPAYRERLAQARHLKEVAPKNGHGHLPHAEEE